MSTVSGVTLQVGCEEDAAKAESAINSWLQAEGLGKLERVQQHYGGSKHPQVEVFGGGYNMLDEDGLGKLVQSISWEVPECVVLLINPEEGPTTVVRPWRDPWDEVDEMTARRQAEADGEWDNRER